VIIVLISKARGREVPSHDRAHRLDAPDWLTKTLPDQNPCPTKALPAQKILRLLTILFSSLWLACGRPFDR
jgi:hypothetical protein